MRAARRLALSGVGRGIKSPPQIGDGTPSPYAKGPWWADARLARTLARYSWVVLIAGFVLGTRFPTDGPLRFLLPLSLSAASTAMNFPTALGLAKSRQHRETTAYRLVAVMLVARLLSTVWVVFMLLA